MLKRYAEDIVTVEELEEQIGTRLPEDYRAFLAENDGFSLEESQTFPLTEKTPFGDSGILDKIFILDDFDRDGVRGFQDENMLIVGEDLLFGCLTCLCLCKSQFGHVFYYDIQQRCLLGG